MSTGYRYETRGFVVFRWLVLAAGAVLVLVSLASALGRFGELFDLVGHFRPFLLIAAVVVAGLALIVRTPAAAAVLGVVALGHLAGLLTTPVAERREAAPAGYAARTVMTMNLLMSNDDLTSVAEAILTVSPDIVVMQEASSKTRRIIDYLKPVYPHSYDCVQEEYCFLAIMSKEPWANVRHHKAPGFEHPFLVATYGEADGTPFHVVGLRMFRPNPGGRQFEYYDRLAEFAVTLTGDVLIAGDMNATPWSFAVRDLARKTDLRPMNRTLATWPADGTALLPIDQVFISRRLVNLGLRRGAYLGSDHYPLIAEVGVPLD
ncbi:MAG: endonuclease/exonuclease/phosphatase family protein [Pseudomonadota bacterium]